ncbi:GNAT family N-acetyltransferase [Paenibacillus sp. MBLB4367]|uniref:GNAT family N-acetyltransferase n=1 Tax=Paenibacillus sp. MBLB4367 TaxID=3384767 RepID=UPI00390821E9
MKCRIREMNEADGLAICGWRYEPPYDIYAWEPWEMMVAGGKEFADPEIRKAQYASVDDEGGELIGFAQFFPLVGVTRLGLGLRPDRCGQGRGLAFVQEIVAEAKRRTPDHEIDLEVLVWNDRARKVYEKAGFRITDTYERGTPTGTAEFHCMVYGA